MGVADLEIDEAAFHGREAYQLFSRVSVLGLLVFASGLACGTGRVAGAGADRTGDTDPAVAAARAWLGVFATKDADRLIEITQLPFTFAGRFYAEPTNRCDAEIGDTTRLERLIGCIEARAPKLVAALGRAGELKLEPTERTRLRPSFIEMLGPPRAGERFVRAIIDDEGNHFDLVLLLVAEERGPRTLVSALAISESMVLE